MVTEPLCKEDFWTKATKHVQSPAAAIANRMYLTRVRACRDRNEFDLQAMIGNSMALNEIVRKSQNRPNTEDPSQHISMSPSTNTPFRDEVGRDSHP
jgi:hypothetical protein